MPVDIAIIAKKPNKQDMMDEKKKKAFLGMVDPDEADESDEEENEETSKYDWEDVNECILDKDDKEFEKEFGASKEDVAKAFWEQFENINGYIVENKIYEKDMEEDKDEPDEEKSSWDKKQKGETNFKDKAKSFAEY